MADNDILQGFQLGFQSSLQRQRLKSEAALQRLQEQQIAQAMALKMQENALQNQFRAEMATAAQAMQDATAEEFMVPMPGADVGTSVQGSDMAPPLMPVKNPAPMRRIDAFTQFMLPVISKFAPDKAGPIYNDVISNEVRMQQEQRLQEVQPLSPLGKLQSDRDAALKRGDTKAAAEFDSLIKSETEGGGFAPANVQKELQALSDAMDRKDANAVAALRRKLKLDELSPMKKQQFDAELSALDRDFKLATRPDEYKAKRMEIISRYFSEAQQSGGSDKGGVIKTPDGLQLNLKSGQLYRLGPDGRSLRPVP